MTEKLTYSMRLRMHSLNKGSRRH